MKKPTTPGNLRGNGKPRGRLFSVPVSTNAGAVGVDIARPAASNDDAGPSPPAPVDDARGGKR